MSKVNYNKSDWNKPITKGALLEYTDEFLVPKISELIKESETRIGEKISKCVSAESGALKHELKEYIDKKLDYYTTDIFRRLDKKYQKEKQFKEKVVELFKKYKIGSATDLAYLEGLVTGA